MPIRFQDGKGEEKMKIIIPKNIDKLKSLANDEVEVVMDEFVKKPKKKIQTNSLYGELRGNKNGKQD